MSHRKLGDLAAGQVVTLRCRASRLIDWITASARGMLVTLLGLSMGHVQLLVVGMVTIIVATIIAAYA